MHRGADSEKSVVLQQLISDRRNALMPADCSPKLFEFEAVERKQVVAGFDGGAITSDAGAPQSSSSMSSSFQTPASL